MSDSTKGVFLSYARDDAEAAKRVADALRGFGVEVWFDQNELRGGDSWDAKIRRQIRECALFVPIISARSEGRHEGYFRREWNLAVERTLDMAHDAAFLVPVVIDGTPENEARVPDKFRTVQWTRLPGGEPNPHFVERVKRLLESPGKAAPEKRSGLAAPLRAAQRKSVPVWVGAMAAMAVAGAVLGWVELRRSSVVAVAPPPAPSATSESGALVARARALYERWDLATPVDFAAADQMLKRAVELDPSDGEAWTHYALMSCGLLIFNYEDRDTRLPIALEAAQRAVSLAPDSDYAQFALAFSYRFQPATQEECLRRLRALAARCPTDKFILRSTGGALRALGYSEESIPYFDRAAALPGGDPIAWYNRCISLENLNRFDEAETALDQALALEPSYGHAMIFKAFLMSRRGDLAGAQSEIGRVPAGFFAANDEGAALSFLIWEWSRRADKALDAIASVARAYLHTIPFSGPKGFLAGFAYRMDGRTAAAQAEWRAALQLIDQRLAANPNYREDLYWQAFLRALLGDRAGAETSLQLYQQMGGNKAAPGIGGSAHYFASAAIYAALDRRDEALEEIAATFKNQVRPGFIGYLHFSPEMDPLRDDPRFKAILAQVDAANHDVAARLHEAAK